jgi:hypothetical protein
MIIAEYVHAYLFYIFLIIYSKIRNHITIDSIILAILIKIGLNLFLFMNDNPVISIINKKLHIICI